MGTIIVRLKFGSCLGLGITIIVFDFSLNFEKEDG